MTDTRTTNRALLVHVLLPTLFLSVALLGGVRVGAGGGAVEFVPPPLVSLLMASMLLALFARGRLVEFGGWLSAANTALANVSHALTLASLFFASAQAFNSVLPDAGLPRLVLASFFLWTLWQNQFSPPDARRLLRGLAALFGTAFVVKHMLLASLFAPGGGWLRRLAGAALEGVTLGTVGGEAQAPATGYVSFFTLALYVCGLALLPASPGRDGRGAARADELLEAAERLPAGERARLLAALAAAHEDAPPEARLRTSPGRLRARADAVEDEEAAAQSDSH